MELESTPPWPAAKQSGKLLVAHPAWEDARNAILDLAAEGPVTVALVGPPGTGKTWLLRELAGCLGDHGFPTMVLLQGDLPTFLADGAALLVDQALSMPEPALDELLAQRRGVAILSDVERFGAIVQARSAEPVVIPLRVLDNAEMSVFAVEWLRRSAPLEAGLDPTTVADVIEQAQGVVGRAVRLLTAANAARRALHQSPSVTTANDRAAIPHPAALKQIAAEPVRRQPQPIPMPPVRPGLPRQAGAVVNPTVPRRRAGRRVIMASTALAAGVVLAWTVGAGLSRPEMAPLASTTRASLPPLSPAEVSAPVIAGQSAPAPATLPAGEHLEVAAALALPPQPTAIDKAELAPTPDLAPTTEPTPTFDMSPNSVRIASRSPTAEPAALATPHEIDPAPHVETVPAAATIVARLDAPAAALPAIPPVQPPAQHGGAGMVLLAQRGDTLESMYRDIYRDRAAPPYAQVVAANPRPVKPGVIVVFPEPPGGWSFH